MPDDRDEELTTSETRTDWPDLIGAWVAGLFAWGLVFVVLNIGMGLIATAGTPAVVGSWSGMVAASAASVACAALTVSMTRGKPFLGGVPPLIFANGLLTVVLVGFERSYQIPVDWAAPAVGLTVGLFSLYYGAMHRRWLADG